MFRSFFLIPIICLTSCVSYMVDNLDSKPVYMGDKPASVIPDNGLTYVKLMPVDPYELPSTLALNGRSITYHSDGTPYGLESEYRNCVNSPYPPFRRLDTAGLSSGQKVRDPYDGKPFYLP